MAGTKANGTSWKKGQSGNPTGLSKATRSQKKKIRDLARTYTEEAITAVIKVLRDKKSTNMEVLRAADAIFDRGHGRPAVSIEVGGEDGRAADSPLSYADLDKLDDGQIAMLYKEGIDSPEELAATPTDGPPN